MAVMVMAFLFGIKFGKVSIYLILLDIAPYTYQFESSFVMLRIL